MRVLFCINSLGIGGAERVISNLANKMCKENEVYVMVSKDKDEKYSLDKKVNYVVLDNYYIQNKIKRYCLRLKRTKSELKKINPDVIISFLPEPCIRMAVFKYTTNSKLILAIRDDPKVDYKKLLYRISMKLFFNRADAFVFQTNEQKNYFNKKIQDKGIIIFNPINEKFIREPYNKKRNNIIINSGRLSKQKNQKLLIDAFKIVNDKYPELKLYIFGKDDNKKEELLAQIKKLNLDNKVFLKGVSNNMEDEIYEARMFVLSSLHEGLPNALLEAMASGVPCISVKFSGGGAEEVIKNNVNGLLTESNVNSLAAAMIYYIENYDISIKFGKNAAEAMKNYTTENVINLWYDYINKIRK